MPSFDNLRDPFTLTIYDGEPHTKAGYRQLAASSPPNLTTVGATRETGEPSPPAGPTIWLRWIPRAEDAGTSVHFAIDGYDTSLTVLSAPRTLDPATITFADLTTVGSNDDAGTPNFFDLAATSSVVTVSAVDVERVYYLQVGGFSDRTGAVNVYFPGPAEPPPSSAHGSAFKVDPDERTRIASRHTTNQLVSPTFGATHLRPRSQPARRVAAGAYLRVAARLRADAKLTAPDGTTRTVIGRAELRSTVTASPNGLPRRPGAANLATSTTVAAAAHLTATVSATLTGTAQLQGRIVRIATVTSPVNLQTTSTLTGDILAIDQAALAIASADLRATTSLRAETIVTGVRAGEAHLRSTVTLTTFLPELLTAHLTARVDLKPGETRFWPELTARLRTDVGLTANPHTIRKARADLVVGTQLRATGVVERIGADLLTTVTLKGDIITPQVARAFLRVATQLRAQPLTVPVVPGAATMVVPVRLHAVAERTAIAISRQVVTAYLYGALVVGEGHMMIRLYLGADGILGISPPRPPTPTRPEDRELVQVGRPRLNWDW